MALAYLLSPTFQFVNTAGRPLTGGYLEVYIAGSRDKYYCASDFNGTLHPFRIPLDSLGASVVLADDGHSYDVYAYNRYGGLSMSRYNVSPGGGGISSGSITSTDGSIVITQTQGGVDLRVNLEAPTVMRCSAEDLTSDGSFQFTQVQRDGQGARVVSHNVNIDRGWWHYDATVRIRWQGAAESTQQVGLYSSNGSDTMDFDLSYPHSETVRLSGEYKAAENGTTFTIGFTGIVAGMTASLVDFGIHTITNGSGAGGQYYAGDGIEVNESDRIISAKVDGTTIDTNDNGELEVIGGQDIYVVTHESGGSFPASLFDDAYAAYQAGKTLVYVEGERRGMFIGYYSPYGLMFALDVVNLSGSAPTDADGFIDFVWLYRSDVVNPHSGWRHTSLNLVPMHRQEDAGKVLTVDTEHPLSTPVWTSLPNFSDFVTDTELSTILEGYQTALSAGANIQINNGTISATDTTYTAGNGLSLSGTEFSVDTNTVALKSDLPGEAQLVPEYTLPTDAGKVLMAGSTTYWASLSDYVTDTELSTILEGYQTALTAGSNIQISNGTISATDTTYTAGTALDLTGTEFSVKVDGTTVTVNSSGELQAAPAITVDQTYDPTSTNPQSGTAVAQAVAGVDTGLFQAEYGVTAFADIAAAITAKKAVYCKVSPLQNSSRMAFLAYYKLAGNNTDHIEFQYYRSNGDADGADSVFVYDVTRKNVWTTAERTPQKAADWNAESGTFNSIAHKPDLSVYATTSAMNTALATKQDTLTAGTNITISAQNEISAVDTTYTAGSGLDLTGTEFSVDTTTIATKAELADYVTDTELSTILQGYQEALTAGSNITISNGTISATDTTYTAGTGLDLTGTEFSVDTTTIATKSDLSDYTPTASLGAVALSNDYDDLDNKPTIPTLPDTKNLVAGSNVTIVEGQDSVTINAADTTYSAGSGISITNNVIACTATFTQQQANWNESDSSSVQYIMNKPTIPTLPATKNLVAGNNLTITEGQDSVTLDVTGIPTIGTVEV